MRANGAKHSINRHFKREALAMGGGFVVPLVMAIAGAIVVPIVLGWLR